MRGLINAAGLIVVAVVSPALARPDPGTLRVTYEVAIWGHYTEYWQIGPDGHGEIWRMAKDVFRDPTIRKFRLRLSGDGLTAFKADSRRLASATRHAHDCPPVATDGPYGSVTWTDSEAHDVQRFGLNSCLSAADDSIANNAISDMSDIVNKRAEIDPAPFEPIAKAP